MALRRISSVSLEGSVVRYKQLAIRFIELIQEYSDDLSRQQGTRRRLSQSSSLSISQSESWSHQRENMIDEMEIMLEQVKQLFAQEQRCIQIKTPAYVIGDIHGNIKDPVLLARLLWRKAFIRRPTSVNMFNSSTLNEHIPSRKSRYVFLGDLVDRGPNSLEVVLYLFSWKILRPNYFILIRGNHEVWYTNQNYTFKDELITKFGHENGNMLWEMFNDTFDYMPLCGVIDKKIFCCHGGIPRSNMSIHAINAIRCPLRNPKSQSRIADEIMWSDPCPSKQFNTLRRHQHNFLRRKSRYGINIHDDDSEFLFNEKRNAGYLFNERALDKFLHENGLTFLIRSHEYCSKGYKINLNNRCLTVFSNINYCNQGNKAAFAMVESCNCAPKVHILELKGE